MGRRRREPSLLETAAQARWPLSAALAGFALVVGVLIIPKVLSTSPLLLPFAAVVRLLGWLAVAVFGVMAAFKFWQEAKAAKLSGHVGATPFQRSSASARSSWELHDDAASPAVRAVPLPPVVARAKPTEWSLELLRSIEWKRFEEVVAEYFRQRRFRCETLAYGPDGGIDAKLFFGNMPKAVAIVQCKAWSGRPVGVKPLRELLGVMVHEKVTRGYFAATGGFTQEAVSFCKTSPIMLISGDDFLTAIRAMPAETQRRLLEVSTEGDYTTPTCASCGLKMVRKEVRGQAMWGCRDFPRCRSQLIAMKRASSD